MALFVGKLAKSLGYLYHSRPNAHSQLIQKRQSTNRNACSKLIMPIQNK